MKYLTTVVGFIAFFFFSASDLEAAQVYHPDGTPSATPIIDQPYGYTGRREDAESGLHYFRSRYYSAEQGRFISRDPTGYVNGYGLYGAYFAERLGVDPSGNVAINAMDVISSIGTNSLTLGVFSIELKTCTEAEKGNEKGYKRFSEECTTTCGKDGTKSCITFYKCNGEHWVWKKECGKCEE